MNTKNATEAQPTEVQPADEPRGKPKSRRRKLEQAADRMSGLSTEYEITQEGEEE